MPSALKVPASTECSKCVLRVFSKYSRSHPGQRVLRTHVPKESWIQCSLNSLVTSPFPVVTDIHPHKQLSLTYNMEPSLVEEQIQEVDTISPEVVATPDIEGAVPVSDAEDLRNIKAPCDCERFNGKKGKLTGRNLVVCIDGTANQFSRKVGYSLVKFLDKRPKIDRSWV